MKQLTGFFIILLLAASTQLQARDYLNLRQDRTYITLGSCGYFSAANIFYERQLAYLKNSEFNFRAGLGYADSRLIPYVGGYYGPTATVGFGFVRGYAYNYFEFDFGAAVLYDINYKSKKIARSLIWAPSLYFGYRFKRPYSPFLWRVGVGWPEQIAVGFGYSF